VEAWGPALARRFAGVELELREVLRLGWGTLELRGLHARSRAEQAPWVELDLEVLEVEFGAGILLGRVESLQEVRASGLRLLLAQASSEAEPSEGLPSLPALPQGLPRVELSEAQVIVEREAAPDLEFREVALALDEAGRLRASVAHDGRTYGLGAFLGARGLEDLRCNVDGRELLEQSSLQHSASEGGSWTARLKLLLGETPQEVEFELAPEGLRWDVSLRDLDLVELGALLPPDRGPELDGRCTLQSRGAWAPDRPWSQPIALRLELEDLRWGEQHLASADAVASIQDGELLVEELELHQSAANSLRVTDAGLPLRGTDLGNWLERARGELLLDARDLPALARMAGQAPTLTAEESPHRLELVAQVAGGLAQLREGHFESQAGHLRLAQASVARRAEGVDLALRGDLDLPDLAGLGALLGREGWSGACTGLLDLKGSWPELAGSLELAGTEVVLEGQELGGIELRAATRGTDGRVELERLRGDTPWGTLAASGALELRTEPRTAELRELSLTRGGVGMVLERPAAARWSAAGGRVEELVLSGEAGALALGLSWEDDDLQLRLVASSLRPELLLGSSALEAPPFEGADLQLLGSRTAGALTFASTGHLRGLHSERLPGPSELRWQLDYGQSRLELGELVLEGGPSLSASLTGSLPLDLGSRPRLPAGDLRLTGTAHLPLELADAEWGGDLAVDVDLNGSWEALAGQLELTGEGLRAPSALQPEGAPPGRLAGTLQLADGLVWQELQLDFGESVSFTSSGRIGAPLDAQAWLDEPAAVLRSSSLEAKLQLAELDLARIDELLAHYGASARQVRAGRLHADLSLAGTLEEPRLQGGLDVDGGRVRLGSGLPPIDELAARLTFDADRMQIESCGGTLGASPFEVQGAVELGGEGARLDLRLAGQDLLLFRDPSSRVRADTDVTIRGPLDALVISGKVDLTHGNHRPDPRFLDLRGARPSSGVRGFQLFSLREPPLRDLRFDVQLGAQKPFEVRSPMVRGGVRPRLHLGGSGQVPLLTGSVFLERTLLELPATRLELSGGTIRFEEDNPFVPQMELVGQTRMLGYDIRANISGPYDTPEVQFSSTPPLSQENLFLLVVTGKLPSDPDQTDGLATANTVALYLARDTLSRWFEDDGPVDEDSMLERLDFSIGEDVSKNGTETVEVAYRLSSRADLEPERKNARHWYLHAERDKYEDYNYGLRLVFRFRR